MKILITGGLGYIGSVTAQMLIDIGQEVIIVDNYLTGSQFPKCRMYDCDVRDSRIFDIIKAVSPDVVIHLADRNNREDSLDEPEKYYSANVNGLLSVMNACIEAGVGKFILGSSMAVYGEPSELPIGETELLHPKCIYGRTKVICEQYLFDVAQRHDIKFAILRIGNVAGATFRGGKWFGEVKENCSVINEFANNLVNSLPCIIYGGEFEGTYNGTAVRDFIHVEDVAKAIVIAIKRVGEDEYLNSFFNVSSGLGVSIGAVLEQMVAINGSHSGVILQEKRPWDAPAIIADVLKADYVLGWQKEKGIMDIITSTFEYQQYLQKKIEDKVNEIS